MPIQSVNLSQTGTKESWDNFFRSIGTPILPSQTMMENRAQELTDEVAEKAQGEGIPGEIFVDPGGGIWIGHYVQNKVIPELSGTYYRQIGDVAPNLNTGKSKDDWDRFFQAGTRRTPGTTSSYADVLGDEALNMGYGDKLFEALSSAVASGELQGALGDELAQVMSFADDPQALAQMVSMMLAVAAAKKAACKAGLTGFAGAAFTAKEAADAALTASQIKSYLDNTTFMSEVHDAGIPIAKIVAGLIKDIGFAELMKLIKCFAAGTQVVVAEEPIDAAGRWKYRTVAIETLKEGDLVLAREEHGSTVKLQRIEETFLRISDHLRVLEFTSPDGGTQTIKTTDEHPFWSVERAAYVTAGELPVGTIVAGPNGELQTLTTTVREAHAKGVLVYNFRVAEYHTYFVAAKVDNPPLLVHNAKDYSGGKNRKPEFQRNTKSGNRSKDKPGTSSKKSGPGKKREQCKQDSLRKSNSAKDGAKQALQDRWDEMPDAAKKMLRGVKGYDPDA